MKVPIWSKKKHAHRLNMLKLFDISQEDADRLMGGLLRLEGQQTDNWSRFMKKTISLGKTSEERNFVWYLLGIKMGVLAERGLVVMMPFNKDVLENLKKKEEGRRPEIE